MQITVLKSKLKDVIVTDANVEYNGSLTLDPLLMEAAFLVPYERVEVNSKYGTGRIVTYVLPGENGSGQVELNGGAANFFQVGEHVHVNCFCQIDDSRTGLEPRVVVTKEFNEIVDIK